MTTYTRVPEDFLQHSACLLKQSPQWSAEQPATWPHIYWAPCLLPLIYVHLSFQVKTRVRFTLNLGILISLQKTAWLRLLALLVFSWLWQNSWGNYFKGKEGGRGYLVVVCFCLFAYSFLGFRSWSNVSITLGPWRGRASCWDRIMGELYSLKVAKGKKRREELWVSMSTSRACVEWSNVLLWGPVFQGSTTFQELRELSATPLT